MTTTTWIVRYNLSDKDGNTAPPLDRIFSDKYNARNYYIDKCANLDLNNGILHDISSKYTIDSICYFKREREDYPVKKKNIYIHKKRGI